MQEIGVDKICKICGSLFAYYSSIFHLFFKHCSFIFWPKKTSQEHILHTFGNCYIVALLIKIHTWSSSNRVCCLKNVFIISIVHQSWL